MQPNRRTFELIVVCGMLLRPVFGSARIWAVKTMARTEPGSFVHTAAEVVAILT